MSAVCCRVLGSFQSFLRHSFPVSPFRRRTSHSFSSHPRRNLSVSASNDDLQAQTEFNSSSSSSFPDVSASVLDSQQQKQPARRWKPTCLYHTQGKCSLMDPGPIDPSVLRLQERHRSRRVWAGDMSDSEHLQKFNHDILLDIQLSERKLNPLCSSTFDTFIVLDLEGKVEILEFPVLLIDGNSTNCIDFFHRFVRPVRMGELKINEYILGKYGPIGVDRVWHDTAITFEEVLQEFEAWLRNHHLLNDTNGALHRSAFVTCGNWDMKTKIPQQCKDSGIRLPPYFMEWINLKDVYLNFYKRRAPGMRSMLQQLGIPLVGSHHLGIDDTKNIARILQRMILDGSSMVITARRKSIGGNVEFLFENRIDRRQDGRQKVRR